MCTKLRALGATRVENEHYSASFAGFGPGREMGMSVRSAGDAINDLDDRQMREQKLRTEAERKAKEWYERNIEFRSA